jgi:ATP-dependent Lon protease
MRRAISSFQQLVTLAPHLPAGFRRGRGDRRPASPRLLHASRTRLTTEQRQEIRDRLGEGEVERLLGHMSHGSGSELGRKIQTQAEEQMGKAQREYFLREQLKEIQRELGELDSELGELGELRERIVNAGLPPEAQREADREIARLERIPSASPESSVIRTYLELIVARRGTPRRAPGGRHQGSRDSRLDHYDLDKVKRRIVDPRRRLKQQRKSTASAAAPILCFVGPPA